jgi:signal transduction histidine kinase
MGAMAALLRPLREGRTYRELLFLLSGAVSATVWFGVLLAGWLAVGILAVTPLLVPAFVAFRIVTRWAARLEGELARSLLGTRVAIRPGEPLRGTFWGILRSAAADQWFWRQQAYLAARVVAGFGIAVAAVSAIGLGIELLVAPIVYRWGEIGSGTWRVHTLGRALLLVPAGLALLLVTAHLIHPAAAGWSRLARSLLDERAAGEAPARLPSGRAVISLRVHASLYAALNLLLIVIWALTTRTYFWPEWTLMPLGMLLGIHAWTVWVLTGPRSRRILGSTGLTVYAGAAGALFLFFTGIWAVTRHHHFWPIWPFLAFALVGAVWGAVAHYRARNQELTERIDTLTTSRAGAVDVSEADLRRIERDLHDGAQARLVALGMSLGMAEQKLAAEPDRARELLAEARVGVGEALQELRDLARGIRPPILADRGLEAAVAGLAAASPLDVEVTTSVDARPPAPVETAAYFVVAEALANATKHGRADHVSIRIRRGPAELSVEVVDDGGGGADEHGSGLTGLRRRVEALDGSLQVTSPPGGPTRIEAVLPCAS